MCNVKGCPITDGIRIQDCKGITNLHQHFQNLAVRLDDVGKEHAAINAELKSAHTHTREYVHMYSTHTHSFTNQGSHLNLFSVLSKMAKRWPGWVNVYLVFTHCIVMRNLLKSTY